MIKSEVRKLLVAGGGTGGHVLAGIAVAETWLESQKTSDRSRVLFVGSVGGIEEKLVPRAKFSLKVLNLGALNRVSLKRKLKTFYQLPFSFVHAFWILMSFRPQVVLGVGGYSSGPIVLLASVLRTFFLLRTRVGILEQNAVPGMTNRILSHFSDVVLTSFPGTQEQFKGKHVVLTGNPVRSSMRQMDSASRDPFTIFIFGGSQGAVGINTLVLAALPHLADLKSQLRFIHQTGEKDFDRVGEGYRKTGIEARVEKFIYDMATAYAESSLLICRAGSSTLSEVAAVGRAAILIPLPTAADNHQEKNARIFSDQSVASLLLQKDASGEDLAKLIRDFVTNPEKVQKMERGVRKFNRPHAAEDVVKALV